MKQGGLLALLIYLLSTPLALADQPEQVCGNKARIEKVLGQAREILAELRGMSSAHSDYMTRREMTRKADDLRRTLERLDAELALVSPPPPPPIEPPAAQAMEAGRFAALLRALGAESFAKGKLRVVKQAVRHDHFSVEQVRQVMRQFSFADGKVEAAAAMHRRLVDPENFFQAYEELSFEADKNMLRGLIER